MLIVKVVETPGTGEVIEKAVPADSTIQQCLDIAGVSANGAQVKVRGREVSLSDAASEGIVIMVSKKVAGAFKE